MRNKKQRIEKLENKQKLKNKTVVIWGDFDNDEVFYDKVYTDPDRKQLSQERLEQLQSQDNILIIQYTNDWKGVKDREVIN